MFKTLADICRDNWHWRSQVGSLALFDLKKRARGAVLGWFWIIAKPLMYIFVFWFALAIGLRAGSSGGDYPYIIWLMSGLVPWFFMQDMIGPGWDILHKYAYLVNKVKFPQSCISTMYALSSLLPCLVLFVILMAVYFFQGMPLDIHLIQIPLIIVMMFFFFAAASVLFSQLSAMSKDFAQLLKILRQPLFWLSGVIFDMGVISGGPFGWISTAMLFNPVTFFTTACRCATCDHVWFWENVPLTVSFIAVFVFTVVVMALVYRRTHAEVADVL